MPINITALKNTVKQVPFYVEPDIYFHPIKLPSKYKIYSLEKMIQEFKTSGQNGDSIMLCGYPVTDSPEYRESHLRIHPRIEKPPITPIPLCLGLAGHSYPPRSEITSVDYEEFENYMTENKSTAGNNAIRRSLFIYRA